jgi:hypothetical protein
MLGLCAICAQGGGYVRPLGLPGHGIVDPQPDEGAKAVAQMVRSSTRGLPFACHAARADRGQYARASMALADGFAWWVLRG